MELLNLVQMRDSSRRHFTIDNNGGAYLTAFASSQAAIIIVAVSAMVVIFKAHAALAAIIAGLSSDFAWMFSKLRLTCMKEVFELIAKMSYNWAKSASRCCIWSSFSGFSMIPVSASLYSMQVFQDPPLKL